jgi:hypothetical protein
MCVLFSEGSICDLRSFWYRSGSAFQNKGDAAESFEELGSYESKYCKVASELHVSTVRAIVNLSVNADVLAAMKACK